MQELVTVEQADAVIGTLAWAGPVAGLIAGAIAGVVQGRPAAGAARGLAVGLLGTIVWAMWLLYSYLVRYNPETGEAGLHSVSTLVFSALIFLVVGLALGGLYSRIVFARSAEETEHEVANNAETHTK